MKPLHGLRSWIFAEGWALTAVGLAGVASGPRCK